MTQRMRPWRLPMGVAVITLVTAACSASPSLTPGSSVARPTASASTTAEQVLNGQTSLAAGRYQVDPTLLMTVTVAVPAGWGAGGNWVVTGPKGHDAPNGMAIRFYQAVNMFMHPLVPADGVISPPVGPSVDDLVSAMVNHPDWTVTGHSAITMDGYSGQVVHVTLPAGTSDGTPFNLFGDADGPQEWGWAAGQLFDIYVVDVGGERLVVDAFHYPGTSADDVAAQSTVIDSIKLTP